MHWKKSYFLFLLVVDLCAGQQPADKGANAKTKQVLDYIAGLSKQSTYKKMAHLIVSYFDYI
jgi:hypothetical protein